MHSWTAKTALLVLASFLLTSCDSGADDAGGGDAAGATSKIKFKDGKGQEAFSLKTMSDGAKVVAKNGDERFRLKRKDKGDKVKIKGPDDAPLGAIKGYDDGKLKLKDAANKDLFVFRKQEDGDYKLETAAEDKLVYKVKQRDYGWKVEDAEGKELFKVKLKDGKTSLRVSDDETRYYTKDTIKSLAVVALGLDELSDSQKWLLLYRLNAGAP